MEVINTLSLHYNSLLSEVNLNRLRYEMGMRCSSKKHRVLIEAARETSLTTEHVKYDFIMHLCIIMMNKLL